MASIERRPGRLRQDGTQGPDTWRVHWREGLKHRAQTFPTEAAAKRHRTIVEADQARGGFKDPRGAAERFGPYAERWLAAQAHSPATVAVVESRLSTHVLPTFADRRLGAISRTEVQAWVTDLSRSKGLAPSTVRVIYAHLRTIMRAAVDDDLIVRSPCTRISLPRPEGQKVIPLAAKELGQLIDATPRRFQAWVIAGVGLGLRQGELCGLTIDRVDFAAQRVHIDRQLITPARGEVTLGHPKTASSVRTLPLPTKVAEVIHEHVERFGLGRWGLVFSTPPGEPIRRNRAADIMRRAVAKAGLDPSITPHSLRHTYASALIEAGASVTVVQARLGHRSPIETLSTYAHLWPGGEGDTIAAVDALLGDALPGESGGTSGEQ